MYRNRQTGEVVSDRKLRRTYRNVSFPRIIKADILDELGFDPILEGKRPIESGPYQSVVKNGLEQIDGVWYTSYEIVEPDAEEKQKLDDSRAEGIRIERNQLLSETDWAVLPDVSTPEGILEYRQALRDVTKQEGFPHNVVMPELSDYTST